MLLVVEQLKIYGDPAVLRWTFEINNCKMEYISQMATKILGIMMINQWVLTHLDHLPVPKKKRPLGEDKCSWVTDMTLPYYWDFRVYANLLLLQNAPTSYQQQLPASGQTFRAISYGKLSHSYGKIHHLVNQRTKWAMFNVANWQKLPEGIIIIYIPMISHIIPYKTSISSGYVP